MGGTKGERSPSGVVTSSTSPLFSPATSSTVPRGACYDAAMNDAASRRILAGGVVLKLGLAWLALAVLRAGLGAGNLGPARAPAEDPRPARVLLALALLLPALVY